MVWPWNKKKKNVFDFKPAMELLELPVVTFYVEEEKLHFLLDTGSTNSIINEKVVNKIDHIKIEGAAKLQGMEGIIQTVPYVSINLCYNDVIYIDNFQVVDMSKAFNDIKRETGITLHGILGTSFFSKYKYIIDFNELIAYSKIQK